MKIADLEVSVIYHIFFLCIYMRTDRLHTGKLILLCRSPRKQTNKQTQVYESHETFVLSSSALTLEDTFGVFPLLLSDDAL